MRYFVDFENVKNNGLVGIENLKKEDSIIIFYNDSSTINMKTHKALESALCQKEYVLVHEIRKNALDFQLSTYLGSFIPKENEFCIISQDHDYDAVISFWKERKVVIKRLNNLKGENTLTLEKDVEKALGDNPDVEIAEIVSIINHYKTKQGINNALVKKYGSTKGGAIYQKIKLLIKNKK